MKKVWSFGIRYVQDREEWEGFKEPIEIELESLLLDNMDLKENLIEELVSVNDKSILFVFENESLAKAYSSGFQKGLICTAYPTTLWDSVVDDYIDRMQEGQELYDKGEWKTFGREDEESQ